jgi:hypothetical protein
MQHTRDPKAVLFAATSEPVCDHFAEQHQLRQVALMKEQWTTAGPMFLQMDTSDLNFLKLESNSALF